MSQNINDNKIMELKERIGKQKESMKDFRQFRPATNCSLTLENGEKYNIRTLDRERATSLLVKLNMLFLSVKDLGLTDEYKVSNFLLKDWIDDIRLKMEELDYLAEKQKLNQLENKLHTLLSEDKKVELEIEEIMKSLK